MNSVAKYIDVVHSAMVVYSVFLVVQTEFRTKCNSIIPLIKLRKSKIFLSGVKRLHFFAYTGLYPGFERHNFSYTKITAFPVPSTMKQPLIHAFNIVFTKITRRTKGVEYFRWKAINYEFLTVEIIRIRTQTSTFDTLLYGNDRVLL